MSKLELEIRPETSDDRARVFEIHEAAFGEPAEARLVDLLRPVAQPQISLVAVARQSAGAIEAGEVIGHVFFSPVEVGDASTPRRAIGLAPVAADPRCQRQGVGDALCRAGLARCLEIGEPVCFVLGHNTYYLYIIRKYFPNRPKFPRNPFEPLANRIPPGPITSGRGLVDEDYARRIASIKIRKQPSLDQGSAKGF